MLLELQIQILKPIKPKWYEYLPDLNLCHHYSAQVDMVLILLWGGEIFRGEGLIAMRIHSSFILTQSPNLLTNLYEISLRVIIQFVFLGCLGIQSSSLEQGKTLNFLSLPRWNVAFARWSLNFIKFIISILISFPFPSKDIFT